VTELVSVYKLNNPFEVVLGLNGRRPIKADLERHHTIIAGSTGSGKTNELHGILCQFFGKNSRFTDVADVYLIDLKDDPHDSLQAWKPLLAGFASIGEDGSIDQAISLLNTIQRLIRTGQQKKRVVLMIDEVAMLTFQAPDATVRKEGERLLTIISSQLRAWGVLICATQHPKWDQVPTAIRYNLSRQVCFMVANRDHAGVILNTRPSEDELPNKPGEFIMRQPGSRQLIHGQAMLVNLPGDIDKVVWACLGDGADSDWRVKLLWDAASQKLAGGKVDGIQKMRKAGTYGQDVLEAAYRNYALAGAFTAPERRGEGYILSADFPTAVGLVKNYIADGSWQQDPKPFTEKEN